MRKLKKTLAVLVAATMLSSTPVWAKEGDTPKLPNHVKETYEEVLDSVPQLKEYEQTEITFKESKYFIHLQKDENKNYPNAWIEIDNDNGELINFTHTSNVEPSTTAPSDELAKEKAGEFLKGAWEDKFEKVKFYVVTKPTVTVEYEDEQGKNHEAKRNMKQVVFKNTRERLFYAIIVDSNGEIYSASDIMNIGLNESDVNPTVQQGVKKLLEVVPRLKEEKYEIERYDRTKSKDDPKWRLQRDEIRYQSPNRTTFTFDNIAGELTHFYIEEKREKVLNPITKEVAKVKAAQFIQQMMKDSEGYNFVGLARSSSHNGDDTTVGFAVPLVEDSQYVKHFQIYVDDHGNIVGAKATVEESTFDFEDYYHVLETEG
ncbi:hypothetical protein [Brevibacillus brevis]|uniref:PepSY domain-containing protein n=1 Tax=Brevibacillus brevis TaxID=1393 RepID=A0A517IDL9_BREBE|nr:hypothetical protein [Brevibacillus brevis]QDS36972.1 hypothetical protein FPS98_25165 [Brevibacillus brevis]